MSTIKTKLGKSEPFACDQKEFEELKAHDTLTKKGSISIRKSASTSSLPSMLADSEAEMKFAAEDKDPTPSYSSDSRRMTPVPLPPIDAVLDLTRSRLEAFLFDSIDTD